MSPEARGREELLTRLLDESGALCRGHFLLSSGRHSPAYVQCALLLEDPVRSRRVGAELASIVDLEGIRTREDEPFVRTVSEVAASVTGEQRSPGTAAYFTDASVLTPAFGGVPTVILGPGEMALCHQTDEHCRVPRIEQAVEIYTELLRRWCGA